MLLILIISTLTTIILLVFLMSAKQKAANYFGQLNRLENELEFSRQEKQKLNEKIENLQQKNLEFEKQNELLKQARFDLEKQRQEWQIDKELILSKLSEELMQKNQQQQEKISQNQQENIAKITENLFKNFENVAAKLTALDDEVKKSTADISQTKNALLNPAGAGRTSEITLENILKNSNLLEKENFNSHGDYILQSHFSANSSSTGKRPDSIVFLPNDQILIIDSKSSPHFFELEEAQSEDEKKEILGKIKNSFRKHLDDLKRKDYADFLFEELNNKNKGDYKIFSVMFLQTEQMLEIIEKADKDFVNRAFEAKIMIATPITLIHLLSNAKFIIDRFKQEKNIEALKIEVQKLLDLIATVIKDSSEIGRFLNKALSNYNKLAKHLNKSVNLAKNIENLGIESKKSNEIKMIEEFDEEDV